MSNLAFYHCKTCNKVVPLVENWVGNIICCEQTMEKIVDNTSIASKETHLPVIAKENGKLKVHAGSNQHPMTKDHHIEWVALDAGDEAKIIHFRPGKKSIAEFEDVPSGTIYSKDSVYGLMKANF